MNPAAVLVQLVVLFGGTIAIILIDRGRRSAGVGEGALEPEMGIVWLLCVLCNLACLPFYFHSTRPGGRGLAIGIGWFLACACSAWFAGVVVLVLSR